MARTPRRSTIEPWDLLGARRERISLSEFVERAFTVASITIATCESIKIPLEQLTFSLIKYSSITLAETPEDYPDLIWPLAQVLCDDYAADEIDEEHPLFGMTEVHDDH